GCEKKSMEVSQKLVDQNILVTAIRPPTVPKGASRLRVTFSATHTRQNTDYLLESLKMAFEEVIPEALHRLFVNEISQEK
ncbi:MAG: aminotransferase class I/II-fold pyridoxal phosphate-dependent enzyme, partial [Endozoicomonas sp.]